MKLSVDGEADALYLQLLEQCEKGAVANSDEVSPGVILDFDKDGKLLGIEVLGLSARRGGRKLGSVTFETP